MGTIVDECSDALPNKGEAKPPWLERKKAYIAHLRGVGASTMLVSAADKVHNLRAIYSDYCQIKNEIWERFSAPEPKRENILWYYGSLRDVYAASESPRDSRREPLVDTLADLLERLGYDPSYRPVEHRAHS